MKIAIVGGRDFNNYDFLKEKVLSLKLEIDKIISGGADGADTLAERFADEFSIEKEIYYADWKLFGKAAGMIRNDRIVKESDIIIAFPTERSKGTWDTIRKARKLEKQVFIFN